MNMNMLIFLSISHDDHVHDYSSHGFSHAIRCAGSDPPLRRPHGRPPSVAGEDARRRAQPGEAPRPKPVAPWAPGKTMGF